MKNKSKKISVNFAWWLGVTVVGVSLGLTLQFVRAWTEPTAEPPNGNVGAPINTSATAQTKAGGFTASSLKAGTIEGTTVKGTSQLCIGTDCRNAWPTGGTTQTPYTPPACECSLNPAAGVLVWYDCGEFVVTGSYCNEFWSCGACYSKCVARDVWMPEPCGY